MYTEFFGLNERPFSIAPDPQYLYMSSRHKEAMAHLSYGLLQGGCFIVLTGEVGTGKTTLCRNLLQELPDNVDVALILNANINETELLQSLCDELKISYAEDLSQKRLLDVINQHLLTAYAENRHTVLIIDEAQLLSRDVLEQIRLLTNLETTKQKLLQIILIGQPELNDILSRNDMRQLAQRVTARYHLSALQRNEIEDYVNFRLSVAGCKKPLFSKQALTQLHLLTGGIPRKINVLADHSLLSAYSKSQPVVNAQEVKVAAREVFIAAQKKQDRPVLQPNAFARWWLPVTLLLLLNIGLWWWFATPKPELVAAGNPVPTSSVAQEDRAQADDATTQAQTESASSADVPGADAPTVVAPSVDTPSAVAPSAVAPSAVAPSAVAPSAVAPSVVAPSVDTPVATPPDTDTADMSESVAVAPSVQSQNTAADESAVVLAAESGGEVQPETGTGAESDIVSEVEAAREIPDGTAAEELAEAQLEVAENDAVDLPEVTITDVAEQPGTMIVSDEFLTVDEVVPEPQSSALADILETSADQTGRIAAFRTLADLWGQRLPDQFLSPACSVLAGQGLRCQSVNNWAQLERFNRPAILVLSHNDQLHRVVLKSADGSNTVTSIGGREYSLDSSEVQRHWTGKGVIFWRPDESGSDFLQIGDDSNTLPVLRKRLNLAFEAARLPLLDSLESRQFNLDMSQKVFAMQSRFSIIADSKIGNETYILINEILQPGSIPVLRQRVPES